jgi:hypothetical protein
MFCPEEWIIPANTGQGLINPDLIERFLKYVSTTLADFGRRWLLAKCNMLVCFRRQKAYRSGKSEARCDNLQQQFRTFSPKFQYDKKERS